MPIDQIEISAMPIVARDRLREFSVPDHLLTGPVTGSQVPVTESQLKEIVKALGLRGGVIERPSVFRGEDSMAGGYEATDDAIYISSSLTPDKRLFTLAFIIGGEVIHANAPVRSWEVSWTDVVRPSDNVWWHANDFACQFLLGTEALRSSWEQNKGNLDKMSEFFSVPMPIVQQRCHLLKVIDLSLMTPLKNLQEDWDSYGGLPPSLEAISDAALSLSLLKYRNISPESIHATPDGGLLCKYVTDDITTHWEFDSDGEIAVVVEPKNGSQIGYDLTRSEMPEMITQLYVNSDATTHQR